MRHVFLVALFFCIAVPMARAQDAAPAEKLDPAPTRIEVDAESNVIRFFVDGQQQAVLGAQGLRVKGSVLGNADLATQERQPAGKGEP